MCPTADEEVRRLLRQGLTHYGFAEVDKAIECWEAAQRLDPGNQAARDYLENAYDEVGETSKSADPSLSQTNADSAPSIRVLTDKDDTPAAEFELNLEEGDPDTLVAAALHAYKNGDLDEAWQQLQVASDQDPDRLDVQGYIQLVRQQRAKQWAKDIGDQDRTLGLKCSMGELMNMRMKPDEGFVLSQIDGTLTIAEVLSLGTFDRVRMLEIIAKFISEGIVE